MRFVQLTGLGISQQHVHGDAKDIAPTNTVQSKNADLWGLCSCCRFGDVLGAQACERLLGELRQTRQWHCCAHGRPTVVPLVDLSVLRRVTALRSAAAL